MRPRQLVAGAAHALLAREALQARTAEVAQRLDNAASAAFSPADHTHPQLHSHQGTVWTSDNDGAGSGLDADRLGGSSTEELLAQASAVCLAGVEQAGYLQAPDLSAVAFSGQYADLMNPPDLGRYITGPQCVDAVAASGRFLAADGQQPLSGDLDLGGHQLLNPVVHNEAFPPDGPAPGQLWFDTAEGMLRLYTGEEWLPLGGTGEGGQGVGPGDLPDDGLDEVSNGTLSNEFVAETRAGGLPVDIFDNFPAGSSATLQVARAEPMRSLDIEIAVQHPEASELRVELTAPWGEQVVLHQRGPGDPGGLQRRYPVPARPVEGNLEGMLGRSPAGAWRLKVMDQVFSDVGPGAVVGRITGFSLRFGYLAADRVALAGDLAATGMVSGGAGSFETLSVGGHELTRTLGGLDGSLAALQARVWCLEQCNPAMMEDCRELVCEGREQRCEQGAPLADGTLCSQGRSRAGESRLHSRLIRGWVERTPARVVQVGRVQTRPIQL